MPYIISQLLYDIYRSIHKHVYMYTSYEEENIQDGEFRRSKHESTARCSLFFVLKDLRNPTHIDPCDITLISQSYYLVCEEVEQQ